MQIQLVLVLIIVLFVDQNVKCAREKSSKENPTSTGGGGHSAHNSSATAGIPIGKFLI
jgi:hypothetical protein